MEIFGLSITRTKAAVAPMSSATNPALVPATCRPGSGGWWPLIVREPFAGAWQRNIIRDRSCLLTHSAVYACVTLIASDIGKLRVKLVEEDNNGIWTETKSAAFSPVLKKPNRYQTRQKFLEHWIVSKLIHGNAYILKQRDEREVVTALYVLDPTRVYPLVSPDGSVFYQLSSDNLSGLQEASITVPASEIIHDVMVALYHPLCGVSPITACALPAAHGLSISEHSAAFFKNFAQPGGILTAPGQIGDETANRLKTQWEENYGGNNFGRVAVMGDGLSYQTMSVNAVDAQLLEQLKWTAEQVCTCFHVPAYMVGVGPAPSYNNIGALNTQYYAQCLQTLIEAIEALLDEGLGLGDGNRYGTELDLDGLLLMDAATRVAIAKEGIGAGLFAPNEMRKKFDYKPAKGGDSPMMQQQQFSLEALAERDSDKPFAKPAPAPAASPANPDAEDEEPMMDERTMIAFLQKGAEFREAA